MRVSGGLLMVLAIMPFVAAYNRVALTVTCPGVRQLRFGMNETEVKQVLGAPLKAGKVCCPSWQSVPRDVDWSYHGDTLVLGGTAYLGSTIRVFASFKDGRMVLADVSKRIPPFGNEHTWFVVDEKGVRETQGSREAFCRS